MRRTLTALAILFALALPASASADHRDRANERDGRQYDSAQGFLTVNNPNPHSYCHKAGPILNFTGVDPKHELDFGILVRFS